MSDEKTETPSEAVRSFVKTLVEDVTGGAVDALTLGAISTDGTVRGDATVRMPASMSFVSITIPVTTAKEDR